MLNAKQFFTLILAATANPMAFSQSQESNSNSMVQMGGILLVGKSLHRMADTCSALFPSQKNVYLGLYQASSVPRYLKLFSFDASWPLVTGNRVEQLRSLGMSEQEANTWCNAEFVSELDRFDSNYAEQYDEMQQAFTNLKTEIAKQKQQPPKMRQPTTLDPLYSDLVTKIAETSKLSFDSGNWRLFAELYEPDTFACWEEVSDAADYGYLAIQPIPANATYKITKFTDYMLGNGAFTLRTPTHLMEISYKLSHDGARCGLTERKRWPKHHFFLIQQGESFNLTHYCPLNPAEMQVNKPITAARLAKNLDQLDAEDWQIVPDEVKKDTFFARGALHHLEQKYGFNHEEATNAIDYICDPANPPPQ